MKRRDFIKLAGLTSAVVATGGFMNMDKLLAQAPVVGSTKLETGMQFVGSHAKVYFTKKIDAKHLIMLYNLINESIYGKVAIKLHTGEKHGPNILPRDMDSLVEAADFVQMVEKRQGIKISAPEEIAYKFGWISREKLMESAERYGKSPYGTHLKNVAEGKLMY